MGVFTLMQKQRFLYYRLIGPMADDDLRNALRALEEMRSVEYLRIPNMAAYSLDEVKSLGRELAKFRLKCKEVHFAWTQEGKIHEWGDCVEKAEKREELRKACTANAFKLDFH